MIMKFQDHQMMAMLREDEDFAEWYVESFMRKHLQNYYYEISDVGKREMVINGRNYARGFGIEDEQSQAMFVTLMWQVAANFFEFPGFAEVARDRTLTGPEKIDGFYAVPEEQAVAAIMNPDERYWYPEMVANKGARDGR